MTVSVTFTDLSGLVPEIYYPEPAKKNIPSWFLDLPLSENGKNFHSHDSATAKGCIPLFEAMSSGYVIKTVLDLYVSHNENGHLTYSWPELSSFDIAFLEKSKVGNREDIKHQYATIPRMPNPWGVKTPYGYSCLYVPPMNHDEVPFEIFSGIIDTDKYHGDGHLPFKMKNPEFEGLIPAGTPMAQVFPFKRDSFEMSIGDEKMALMKKKQFTQIHSVFRNAYRKMFWTPKSYK